MKKLTDLELVVLIDVICKRDPWHGRGGSRTVSQALGRLERKGLVNNKNEPTEEGRKAPGCHAGRQDGECYWQHCPQIQDDEPKTTGRNCPLITEDEDE